jgi:vacuolar-type H+-ATPase catalytic subunit A/Vma1
MNFNKEQVWRTLKDQVGNYYSQQSEPEREEFRKWVKDLLRSQAVVVEFVKADGDTRVMTCTLSEQLGAHYVTREIVENQETTKPAKKINTDACAVWDLNQSAWRSFRWDRVKRIEFTLESNSTVQSN